MTYAYTPEMQEVLRQIRNVRKNYTYRNLPDSAPDDHAPILARAYVVAMQTDLFNLHVALANLAKEGYQIIEPTSWETGPDTNEQH